MNGRWWKAATWQRIAAQTPPRVIGRLEVWKQILVLTGRKLAAPEATPAAAAPKELFKGEGEL